MKGGRPHWTAAFLHTIVDDDGHVSGSDLAQLLGAWGTADRRYDLDGDLNVSGSDLAMLLGGWGPCSGEELPLD